MWRKAIATLTLTALLVPFASRANAGPSDDSPEDEFTTTAITPTGGVTLTGRPGAKHLCDQTDPDRKIRVDWLDKTAGGTGPLHIHMTGAGYSYLSGYNFEYWTALFAPWDWSNPATGLSGRDNIDGAMNIMIRFECMSQPDYKVLDIAFNPLDVNYVYELLCTSLHAGTADQAALSGIDRGRIDCSRVGLSGLSGGGLTAGLFLNECFQNLTITPTIRAIYTIVGGFFPLRVGNGGYCPADPTSSLYNYRFDWSTPLFMKVACSDELIPFATYVENQWENSPPPKYLYSRNGGHAETSAQSFIFGEDLSKAFMRYYLFGDTGPSGLLGLDDYPDRSNLRPTDLTTNSYQYQSEIGTNLSGGLCRETFARWSAPTWDNGDAYLEHLKSVVEESAEELPNTN